MPTPTDICLDETIKIRFTMVPSVIERLAELPYERMVSFDRQPTTVTRGVIRFGQEPRPAGVPSHAKPVEWRGLWFWGW